MSASVNRIGGSLAHVGRCYCDTSRRDFSEPKGEPRSSLVGAVPDKPVNRRKIIRRVNPLMGAITGTPFTPCLPPHAFDCRTANCLVEGSRWLPATAQVEILETIEAPRSVLRTPLVPSSMVRSSSRTVRLYRIRYRGPSLGASWTKQYNDEVNGFVDATRVRLL